MKKLLAASLIAATAGGGAYYEYRDGGSQAPHEIMITAKDLLSIATDKKRVCTFKPKAPFVIEEFDYFTLTAPVKRRPTVSDNDPDELKYDFAIKKFRVPATMRMEYVYAMCGKDGVDLSSTYSALGEDNKLVQNCSEEGKNSECKIAYVYEGAQLVNKLNRK